jgi:3-oxoadipate enol-lactonase
VFLEVNGHRLHVVSFGAGPTAFLAVGGWIGDWELWEQPFELLSMRWRCVSFDHRGAGESPVPPEAITPDGLVDDVLGVMDALGIERCIVAGESLGAMAALGAVLRAPRRFRGVVLVDGTPQVTAAVARPLVDGSRADFQATVAAFVERCTPEPGVEHLRRWGRHMLARAEAEAAARLFECYLERKEPPVALDRVAVPALVIHGTADAIVPPSVGEWMARSIPKASLVRIEGAGHVPTVTRPREVVEAILAWERTLPGGTAAP